MKPVNTCINCNKKESYISSRNRLLYSCPLRDDDDIEFDHYCKDHSNTSNEDSYQQVPCCYNCKEIEKSIDNYNNIIYGCAKNEIELEKPAGKCEFYKKDNGGIN